MINNTTNVTNPVNITQLIHGVPAGIHPNDNRIEFWADRKTKEVFFNKNGLTKSFTELPINIIEKLKIQYKQDYIAVAQLSQEYDNVYDQLKAYVFCLFGALDTSADFENGEIQASENFLCKSGTQCQCLKWKTKSIKISGNVLTLREIEVLELIGKGFTVKEIANHLNISVSTVDTHKDHLNKKAGVQSTPELIIKATRQNAIQ